MFIQYCRFVFFYLSHLVGSNSNSFLTMYYRISFSYHINKSIVAQTTYFTFSWRSAGNQNMFTWFSWLHNKKFLQWISNSTRDEWKDWVKHPIILILAFIFRFLLDHPENVKYLLWATIDLFIWNNKRLLCNICLKT